MVIDTDIALDKVVAEKAALSERGVVSLSLFGSRARGDNTPDSDFDFAVKLDRDMTIGAFAFVGIEQELARIIGAPVDLVVEPARKPRMQSEIDQWRRRVF